MQIILMRHAQAEHNVAKRQIRKKYTSDHIKKTPQYISLKISHTFHDQRLSEIGIKQAEAAANQINWSQVELILVSPMKRCLKTCSIMLQKANKKIQVKVEPLIKGRLDTAWGYGSSKEQLKKQFPNFDYQNVTDQKQFPWYINIMEESNKKFYKQHKTEPQYLYSKLQQSYFDFKKRVRKFQKILLDYQSKIKTGGKILVITHSCVLRTLTATQFDKKGKGVSLIKFHNSKPLILKFLDIFQWCRTSTTDSENSNHLNFD